MRTEKYRGYTLYIGFNDHTRVMKPNGSMVEHSYSSVAQAKLDIRNNVI